MITPTSGFRPCFSDCFARVFIAGDFLRLEFGPTKGNAGPAAGLLYSVPFYGVSQLVATFLRCRKLRRNSPTKYNEPVTKMASSGRAFDSTLSKASSADGVTE